MLMYRLFRTLFRILFRILFRLKAVGTDHIPAHGPVILCSNHQSNWDPPIVGTPLDRTVYFMAKEELFKIPVLNWLITQFGAFPVKRGGVSKQSIRRSVELLRQGNVLGIFPEGSRRNTGGMAKKGAASLALKANATVIPVAIIGNYALFKQMKVVYGKPVDLSEFQDEHSPETLDRATEKIMESIQDLIAAN